MQRVAFETVMELARDVGTLEGTKRAVIASAMSRLATTWCSLQDTKREIRGIPRLAPIQKVPTQTRERRLMQGYAGGNGEAVVL
jgi:hypothetical protein